MSKFTIERMGLRRRARIVATERLLPGDFDAIADALATRPMRARKVAPVAGCRTKVERGVTTRWQGEETLNTAKVGDWIVTSYGRDGKPMRDKSGNVNTYVVEAATFERLYERAPGESAEHGPMFRPKGVVDVLAFPGGFDIQAPWGERQTGVAGYLLRNGADIYGNAKATFEETYEIMT